MAAKIKEKKLEGRQRAEFGKMTFVLNNLDDGQLAELDKLEGTKVDVWAFVNTCVDRGLDIKLQYDPYSKGYQAVATGGWVGFPSEGYGTSAYSKHGADDALFVLWYKIEIICEYNLSSAANREKRTKERG